MLQVDIPRKSRPLKAPRRFYDPEKLEAQIRAQLQEGTQLPSLPIPAPWHLPVIARFVFAGRTAEIGRECEIAELES